MRLLTDTEWLSACTTVVSSRLNAINRLTSSAVPATDSEWVPMECVIAQLLFLDYSVVAMEYFGAADDLANLVGSHSKFKVRSSMPSNYTRNAARHIWPWKNTA